MENFSRVATTLPQRAVYQAKSPQNKEARCVYQDRSQMGNKAKEAYTSHNSYSWNCVVGRLLLVPLEHGAPSTQLVIRPTKELVTAMKGL